jgi:hypothetical protein
LENKGRGLLDAGAVSKMVSKVLEKRVAIFRVDVSEDCMWVGYVWHSMNSNYCVFNIVTVNPVNRVCFLLLTDLI